jgi:hypothetical protein
MQLSIKAFDTYEIHLTKISKDTEAANFVKINICVILKTFGHDCTGVKHAA